MSATISSQSSQQESKVPASVPVAKDGKEEDGPMSLDSTTVIGDENIRICSSDKKEYTLPAKVACGSSLIKTSYESDPEVKEGKSVVPIPGVKSPIMDLVVKYLTHFDGVLPKEIERPLRSKVMADVCVGDPFSASFIDEVGKDNEQLYQLILAANYMDIRPLLCLGSAKVASMIKGQPLDKIKDILSTGPKKDEEKKAEEKKEVKA